MAKSLESPVTAALGRGHLLEGAEHKEIEEGRE